MPLSNYAGMDYLQKEIVKLEKLVAERTAPMSGSISRISTAGHVYSPAASTSSSALAQRHVRILERYPSSIKDGTRGSPHTDAPQRSPGLPRRVRRRHEVQIGAGRTTSGFAKKIDLNRGDARTAEPLSEPERRNRLAIRVLAITLKTVQKN